MPKWEVKKIDGLCVTKDISSYHYHVPKIESAKTWYLNSWWSVSTGHCHEPNKTVNPGNPYIDWNYDD